MSALPYYKRFPKLFLDGTIGMDLETKGAYAILLDLIFYRDGRLQEDDGYIAGQLGCSVRKWRAIKMTLQTWPNVNGTVGKIKVADGFITNPRADYLGEETRKYRENQAEKATKPRKNNEIKQPEASHIRQEKVDESTRVDSSRAKARRKPEVAIPDGFPDLPALQAAKVQVSDAGAAVKITMEAERFRNHALTNDRRARDWAAAWRNWIVMAIEKAPPLSSAGPKPDTIDRWPSRVREWKEDQNWNRVDWGPRPGEPGCLCPPELLT